MSDFNTTLTQGPGITVFKPTASPTSSGSGSAVPSAAVAVMSRGPVGRPFRVTADDFEAICGKPLHMREGEHAEGLRHVADALNGSLYVDLVRVAPADARYPVTSFITDSDGDDEAVVTAAVAFGTDPTEPASSWLTIWPTNGDASTDVKVLISNVDAAAKTFDLAFMDTSGTSDVQIGKTISASTEVDAKDDRGLAKYLPSILSDNGYGYECIVDPAVNLLELGILESNFIGGTGGTITDLVAADYVTAWELLDSGDLAWRAGFAAGIYEATVLQKAQDICDARLAEFRFDAPPYKTEADAIIWLAANAPVGWLSRAYHYPYFANDAVYGGQSLWGLSGAQTANKAKCVALPTSAASVAGWLFVPAGKERGRVGRGGVKPLHFAGKATPDELFNARLNTTAQGIYVNDCLSMSPKDDDFKFEATGAVIAAMAYDMTSAIDSQRFAPEGNTLKALQDLAKDVIQRYFDSKSLVQPNSLDVPYEIIITHPESDYFHIAIHSKVGGTTRRMGVQFRQAK